MNNKVLALATTFLVPLSLLAADDLAGAPFSLRFPAALSHFSPFGDVAAKGGASGASPYGSSSNLAGIAWGSGAKDFDYLGSINYNYLTFGSGTDLHIATETIAFDLGDAGTVRLVLIQFQSNTATIRSAPLTYDFDLFGTRLDWSRRFGAYGIGVGMGFTQAETLFRNPTALVSDTTKDNWTFRLAGQRQLGKRWLIGLMADYGTGSSHGTRQSPIGAPQTFTSDSSQWIVQTGIGFIITPKAVANLDYQMGRFSEGGAHLTTHRWSLGTDIPLSTKWQLRAGTTIDHLGNAGWTTGIAFFPIKGTSLNLAYQRGTFPELTQEFGQSQMLTASVSVKW
jgi:hypothetical protein